MESETRDPTSRSSLSRVSTRRRLPEHTWERWVRGWIFRTGQWDAEAGPGWARIQAGGYEDEVDIIGTKDDDERFRRKMLRGGFAEERNIV